MATVGQMLRSVPDGPARSSLRLELLITDEDGQPLDCTSGKLDVTIETRRGRGGPMKQVAHEAIEVVCPDPEPPALALVVDNSGSAESYLPELRAAAGRLLEEVATRQGRASLVRVSTAATELVPLSDPSAARAAMDDLFVRSGWTALYDGVRVAHEGLAMGLEAGAVSAGECGKGQRPAVVLFTDGQDNNSADEHGNEEYPGDGIDTGLEDLFDLSVGGARTPIYPIGLGGDVDEASLRELAKATGGLYTQIDTPEDLATAFERVGRYSTPSFAVCANLTDATCGRLDVRVTYRFEGDSGVRKVSELQTIDAVCSK